MNSCAIDEERMPVVDGNELRRFVMHNFFLLARCGTALLDLTYISTWLQLASGDGCATSMSVLLAAQMMDGDLHLFSMPSRLDAISKWWYAARDENLFIGGEEKERALLFANYLLLANGWVGLTFVCGRISGCSTFKIYGAWDWQSAFHCCMHEWTRICVDL